MKFPRCSAEFHKSHNWTLDYKFLERVQKAPQAEYVGMEEIESTLLAVEKVWNRRQTRARAR